MRRAGQALNFQVHQPLRDEADQLAQEIGVGGLLQQRAQVHGVGGGHCRIFRVGCGVMTKPYPETPMTAAVGDWPVSAIATRQAETGQSPTAVLTPLAGTRPAGSA